MAFDYKKEYKEFYMPKNKPSIVAVPSIQMDVSSHVETVVQLSKGNISSQNVRVEFSLEDMDMSRFQQGATYEQIQAWVQGR